MRGEGEVRDGAKVVVAHQEAFGCQLRQHPSGMPALVFTVQVEVRILHGGQPVDRVVLVAVDARLAGRAEAWPRAGE